MRLLGGTPDLLQWTGDSLVYGPWRHRGRRLARMLRENAAMVEPQCWELSSNVTSWVSMKPLPVVLLRSHANLCRSDCAGPPLHFKLRALADRVYPMYGGVCSGQAAAVLENEERGAGERAHVRLCLRLPALSLHSCCRRARLPFPL